MTAKAENIVLVGFMGAGKSTVGKTLGKLLGYRFIDLDEEIVRGRSRSIPDIFADEGEAAFRNYESEALRCLSGVEKAVIATGGGIIGRPENREAMSALGVVVYLRASWESLSGRIGASGGRPLAEGSEGLLRSRALLEGRIHLYEEADVIVDSDRGSVEEVAREVVKMISAGSRACSKK